MSALISIMFPSPPSLFINAMSNISITSLSLIGISEIMGKHLQCSKFWNLNPIVKAKGGLKLSSKAGMLLLYTPALVACLTSFAFPSAGEENQLRCLLVSSALGAHFLKRVFEESRDTYCMRVSEMNLTHVLYL